MEEPYHQMMIGLKKLFAKLPKSVEGMKPMLLYPILGLLFIALIMFYIINPIFSSVNFAITHFKGDGHQNTTTDNEWKHVTNTTH